MVQDVNIQQVASFQVFVRDNKPKMNAYYPFLSPEQILSKLRQQWKKLDGSERRLYTKLVLTKKKALKTTKVKVVTISGCRLPKGKQTGTSKKADIVRNNDDDDFGFKNLSDDSYIHDDYELDNMSENSPFMRNKFAIDSLNSGFCPDTNKPKINVKKGGVGKTFAGCVPRVTSETVENFKAGILPAPCKDRRKSKGRVGFSAGKATGNDHNGYEFYDEDIDDEVLYVECSTRSKMDTSDENTCRNKAVDMMVPRRMNLEEVEDHSLMLGCQDNPALKYSLTGKELRMPQSKYSLTGGELRMPQSKYSLTGGELMPQSKYSLTGGELGMSQSKNSLTGVELRMSQSKNSLTGEELRMPKSNNSLTGEELRMPKSNNSLMGGELMPQSKNSLIGGELMPKSNNSLTGGELMPQSKNSLIGGELRMPKPKKQKLNVKTPDKTTTIKPSENTPSRFSRRLRNLSPDDVDATLYGCSLHGSSAVHFSEKPKRTSAFAKKATISVKHNNSSVERKGQSFCAESQNMVSEVKVQSCRHDIGNEMIDDQNELQIVPQNCQSEQKLNKKLHNKTAVNRNSVSTKSSAHILDCGVSEFVARFNSRPITPSCQTPVFDFPQSTKRCARSAGHKSDSSDEACTKTSSVKIPQTGHFSEKDTHRKDDDRCRLSEEESDSDFGDRGMNDKSDTDRNAVCHTGKRNVSVYESNLTTRIKQTSENMKTDFFGRESNIHKTKVDNSDKENDRKFDDQDVCYKENNVHTGLRQTRKQTDSVVGTYLKKSTVKKCGNILFDFCGQDTHRKYIASSDEENYGEVIDKDSFLRNDLDDKALYYRNQQNTTETCSKRHTFNETERRISDLSGKENYKHMKDVDRYQECEERNKEFDEVKTAPCTKVSDTSRRQDDLQQHNENGCYQANRVADPLAVYTNKTTERTTEISKGKRPDECEKLKHVRVTKNEIKQVSDKTFVKQWSDMGIVEVVKHSKSESAFQRKNSKSVQKQKNTSKMQKKSAVTRKHTAINHVHRGNNNVKRSPAVTIDNYSINKSWTSPAVLEYDIIQHESHLDNSSTNEEIQHESHLDNSGRNKIIHLSSRMNNSNIKHTQEFGGQHFPSRKETPNFDVEKFKFPIDFSKGSTRRLQNGLLLEEDCSYTSNIDCRKNCQMDCRNTSIMDCRNNPKIFWKAEDGFSSNQESGTSDDSLESDTAEDEETNQDDFLVNMADQTTSALLQAIDRLKSVTSPQVNLTDEWGPDGGPADLPENNDLAFVPTEQQLLYSMFQDVPQEVPQNVNRAYVTPAKKRLLASSATETPSNFMAMFDDSEIFL